MKRCRWNREKFKENFLKPAAGILIVTALGVVWF